MSKKQAFTKALAITGTVLVWLPIGLTVLTSIFHSLSVHLLRFDYLMPAELFPVAVIGSLLLLWAAVRAHSKIKLIGWGFCSALVSLIGGQVFAVISGLASGAVEPTGWPWAIVIASIILYSLSLIMIGITGVSLSIEKRNDTNL